MTIWPSASAGRITRSTRVGAPRQKEEQLGAEGRDRGAISSPAWGRFGDRLAAGSRTVITF